METFIQIWRGNESRIWRSSISSSERNSPILRHSLGLSGGRQSLIKWPALANSAARNASAARSSSTLAELVPSGTVVTISVRYSMCFSFLSLGFSHFCYRLLREVYEYILWVRNRGKWIEIFWLVITQKYNTKTFSASLDSTCLRWLIFSSLNK